MPSGPRKRKSAKRKMESLGLIGSDNGDSSSTPPTALLSPGNGSESGGDTASPTTPGDSGFESELFEFKRSAEAMDTTSHDGGKKSAGEGAAVTHEAVPISADGATEVGVERKKSVEIQNSEGKQGSGTGSSELKPSEMAVSKEEKQEKPVPVSEPSDGKDKKAVSSSDSPSTQASGGGEKHHEQQQLRAETRENRNEAAVIPPQTGHQTSWMNCCGLLDLFKGSHR